MVGDDVHHGHRLCRIWEIGDAIHPVCHKMIQQLALKQMEAGALGELGFKASAMGVKTVVFVSSTKLSSLLIAVCQHIKACPVRQRFPAGPCRIRIMLDLDKPPIVGTFGWKTEDNAVVVATCGTVGGLSVGSSEGILGLVGRYCSCWGD